MTCKRRGNSTGAVIGVPTEDTGKGTEGPAPVITKRYRTIGEAHDAVAEEAILLVRDRTVRTAKAEVLKGDMSITSTPPPRHTEDAGRRSELSGRS